MLRVPDVLLLSADRSEIAQIEGILKQYANLTPTDDLSQVMDLLANRDFDALFCAWSFQKGSWMDVLEGVRMCRPDLPVIVLAPGPNVREWTEVLEAGAFDLLVPPHDGRSVQAVLEHAAATREVLGRRQRVSA